MSDENRAQNSEAIPDAPISAPEPATTRAVEVEPAAPTETRAQSPEEVARALSSVGAPPVVTIPGYEIEGELGRGGMGVVYRARQAKLNRTVAIKMALTGRMGEKDLQRFLAEASAVAALKHPNVVQVYDYGEAGGHPYMVLEYCSGGTLADRIGAGRLDPQTAVELLLKVSDGIAVAHARNVVHRDLKPGNVLFDETGEPKVADFGIAKHAASELTATQAVLGTPAYMSPEQARGDAKLAAPTADVWALGVILYECLAGVRPFVADTAAELRARVLFGKPDPLREHLPTVSTELEGICLKCLAGKPAKRFASAAEVAEALRKLSTSRAPASRIRRAVERVPVWARYGLVALAAAGAGMLLNSGERRVPLSEKPGAGGGEPPVRSGPDPGPAPRYTLRAEDGPVSALAFTRVERLVVGTENGFLKVWDWRTGETIRVLLALRGRSISALDASPDGKNLVVACDDSSVRVCTPDSSVPVLDLGHDSSVRAVAFHPIGKFLATADRHATVTIWEWQNQISSELKSQRATVNAVAYSSDGTTLVFACSDGEVRLWNLKDVNWSKPDGTERPALLLGHEGPAYAVAINADGSVVASAGWDGRVRIWDVARRSVRKELAGHVGEVRSVCFGGAGKWIASAGADGTVRVWEVGTSKEVFIYRGSRAFHAVRFAPDGTTLAAGCRDGNVLVWDVKSVE